MSGGWWGGEVVWEVAGKSKRIQNASDSGRLQELICSESVWSPQNGSPQYEEDHTASGLRRPVGKAESCTES